MERILIWPLFAIGYCLIAGLAIWLVWRSTPNRWARWGSVLFFFPVLLVWDIAPGWLYFDYLCRTEAGLRIFRTVEDVEGVLESSDSPHGCSECGSLLSQRGYRYVEADVRQPRLITYYTVEAGPNRFTLAPLESSQCDTYKLGRRQAGLSQAHDKSLPEGFCLTATRVNQLSARFVYHLHKIYRDIHPVFYLQKAEKYVSERTTGDVLGRLTQYGFGGGWVAANLGFGREYPYQCPLEHEYRALSSEFVSRVLKPADRVAK